tara:strand:- start:14 stop:385 length:372 start_codon:yes stop_codon:yes gene_type:complete
MAQQEVKPYDNPSVHEEEIEPVLAVKQTRVIWLLVFAVLWLSFQMGSMIDQIDQLLVERATALSTIIDHELDDTNDNYEKTLNLLIAGKCDEAAANAYKNKCEVKPTIVEILHSGASAHDGGH